MGEGGQCNAPAYLPPGETLATHCTGLWVGPGPDSMGAENLAHTGIQALNRPARSESQYRLHYPGP
jgi:hypothetical protein